MPHNRPRNEARSALGVHQILLLLLLPLPPSVPAPPIVPPLGAAEEVVVQASIQLLDTVVQGGVA